MRTRCRRDALRIATSGLQAGLRARLLDRRNDPGLRAFPCDAQWRMRRPCRLTVAGAAPECDRDGSVTGFPFQPLDERPRVTSSGGECTRGAAGAEGPRVSRLRGRRARRRG
ncbi:hypothetical protein LF41_1537 [Lysobacter dokdonensis DS-58]|uniref:Uncharacterized protein n=1 Tax=Lysobacter dokdonensis DS-58 TaxID=1300345 RepID=A0A0A2WEM1_9GAMM|nr:hypothetical protein LF41_1537 [Lysobacter dokdonensis DS-58]